MMRGKVVLYLVVLLVGVSFWMVMRKGPMEGALQTRELATRVLAEELAQQYPGSSALVISNPFAEQKLVRRNIRAVEDAGIRGLQAGFGDQVTLKEVVYPEAMSDPRSVYIPDTTTPLSYLIAEDAFDRLAEANPECDLLVSLIGLPAQLDKVELWSRPGPPRLALLLPDLRMVPSADHLRQAMNSGKLSAFVLAKPGAARGPVQKDDRQEFDRHFLLVTATNLNSVLTTYPGLFDFGERGARAY